jgi:uncharacterized protein (TIGR03084 family)
VDGPLLDDLRAEQAVLDDLLSSLRPGDWRRPTPDEGWTVADTVRHLVVAERAAARSVRDGIDFVGGGHAAEPEPAADDDELLDAWRAARTITADALGALDDRARVPWGGREMSARSLATARLMESWAHGLDCFAAVDRATLDTDRLVHVAWLGWRTLAFAFARVSEQPPRRPEELRVELIAPSGATWAFGPPDSRDSVFGPAGTWCRVVTHRLRPPAPNDLVATGSLAEASLRVAQAYLDG